MNKDAIKLEDDTKEEKGMNFIKDNNVYIFGSFDESIAKNVIPLLLKEIDKQKNLKNGIIKFYIDSNGGYTRYLFNLLAIIEDAKKNGITIETHVYGYAYSCGSLLACSGTVGHRFVSYLAEHCLHLGQTGTGQVINDVELERTAERAKSHFDRVRNLYKKYAHVDNLDEYIKFDSWFLRGQQIIDNGLADKMVD